MGFFLVQLTGWKWEISNLVDGEVFNLPLQKKNTCAPEIFGPNVHFQRIWDKQSFGNRLNTFGYMGFLLGQYTGWKWEISNFVDGLSFHLVIAKVKYLLAWNLRPKCSRSTRMTWSKVFENRLNTFGDIGFLHVQFTGWKWKISNLVDGLSSHLAIAKVKYLRT